MRTKGYLLTAALLLAAAVSGFARKETLHIVSTGDVHGCYFDVSSDGGQRKHSLMSVKNYVDSLRAEVGKDNVLLIDAGDILQGDNIAYYYNFVDTVTPHIYPRVAKYMGYDVVTLGNHDIETGHPVYDVLALAADPSPYPAIPTSPPGFHSIFGMVCCLRICLTVSRKESMR